MRIKQGFLLLASGCLWTAGAMGADQSTSWEHAPTDYVVPAGMVTGGAFIDRILPMPVDHGLHTNVWGGDNVKPRNVENGLEDQTWSYWCMDVFQSEGKEHMFAVRWPERSAKGHMTWPKSSVVHAVADRPTGPFEVKQEIGAGHNVMCYQAKDGTYILYVIGGGYRAKSLDGPWQRYELQYDLRGTAPVAMSNHTFTQREDGSYLMISRGGHVWISADGLSPFRKVTGQSVYPAIRGRFEDPVVWRDEVQYNLIVNDWFGRTAYYLRSMDGVNWVWDQGKAYDVDVARHPDGSRERWYKFERPNVRQDVLGRATHIYFAVIDSRKDLDRGGDEHSSKIIALPLTVQRRIRVLDEQPITDDPRQVRVVLQAEEGFEPAQEVDVASLVFGAPTAVDFGKGGKVVKSEIDGRDLVLTFAGDDAGFKAADAVGKLLGRNRRGDLLFGYARLPGQSKPTAILSPAEPRLATPVTLAIQVVNFGLAASEISTLDVKFRIGRGQYASASAVVPALQPYAETEVVVPVPADALKPGVACDVEVSVPSRRDGTPLILKTKITPPAVP